MNSLTSAIIFSCVVIQTFGAFAPVLRDSRPRITGGASASSHQFKYQISLQLKINQDYIHYCGGSVLTPTWILTAGHCVTASPSDYQVIAGMLVLHENNTDIQVSNVVQMIVHPDYPGGVNPNDIALVQLETALVYSDAVQPINLPEPFQQVSGEVVLSGWGSTSTTVVPNYPEHLQFINLPILKLDDCGTALTQLFGTAEPLASSNLCTGPLNQEISACSGDSGGPLAQDNTVFGVVSWGVHPCGFSGAPSVYTAVSYFIDFIQEHVTDL